MDNILKKSNRVLLGRVFKSLVSISSKTLFFIIIVQLLMGVVPALNVVILQKIMNGIQDGQFSKLNQLIFIYIFVEIIKTILSKIQGYVLFKFNNRLTLQLNLDVLNKTKDLELNDFEDAEIYNLIQRAQSQSNEGVFGYFMDYISIISTIITVVTSAMIIFDWRKEIILVIVGLAVIKTLSLVYFSKKQYGIIRKRTSDDRRKWYYEFLLTNDIAFKEIKVFNLYNFFINKFTNIYNTFFEQDKKIMKQMTMSDFILTLGDVFIVALIFILSIQDAVVGIILIGDTVAYIRSSGLIKSSIDDLTTKVTKITNDTLYISQLYEFLDLDVKVDRSEEVIEIGSIENIRMENVSFSYPDSNKKYILKDVNLNLNKGNKYYIVGKNGSGKTTLVKIISGMYANYEGTIYINGTDLRLINKESYRQQLTILFQDYTRYELSLRENISLGNLERISNDDDLLKAIKQVNLFENQKVNLDQQLGYWFDEGTQLSGGQWIKVALTRSFLRDSSVVVLDEPNASLDNVSEQDVLRSYTKLVDNKIGVIVTHRLENIKSIQDTIIVIKDGEIDSIGQHTDLLQKSLTYKELYEAKSATNKQ